MHTANPDAVAIVTGGASGIGRALCQELATRGAHAVVADINLAGAREVAAAIAAGGARASAAPLDVADASGVSRLIEETIAAHGRLDYMFNNAGVGVGGEVRDLTLEHWRRAIETNLWGVIHGTYAAYPAMLRQGFGHIVNIASLAGLIGAPGLAPYAVTKSGVVALSLALRAEARDLGVRVSVACPGFVDTAIFEHAIGVQVDRDEFLAGLPFGLVSAGEAARRILRGVAHNRSLIVFPTYARCLWWLTRLHPSALTPLQLRSIRRLRAALAG